jgi:hypothetical protein
MATSIIERPHEISFTENDARYILQVTDPTAAGCAVEIELYYATSANITPFTKLITVSLTPNPDGTVYFYANAYLKSLLQLQLPTIGGALVQGVPSQSLAFIISYRQVTTADDSSAFTQDEDAGGQVNVVYFRTLILGGVERIKFKRNNFFVSYLQNSKAFLTWQPGNKFIYIDQPVYLTFLLTAFNDFTVKIKTVFTDATIDTSKQLSINSDGSIVWRIDTSVKRWGLDQINPAKNLYYYEVSVESGGNTIVNPYRYYIEYNRVYTYWDFNYFNSLGGFDGVRVVGETEKNVEVQSEQQEHIIFKDTYNTDRPQAQFNTVNAVKKDNYKGDAGYLNTVQEQESLIELMLDKGIFEMIDGRWIQVINIKKSLDIGKSTDKKWSFPVEWSYGYEESVFTPKAIMLGAGTSGATSGGTGGTGGGGGGGSTTPTPTLTLLSDTVSNTGPFGLPVRSQVFEVGVNVAAGNRFQLVCYGHIVEVTAVSGDTPSTIATKLSDAVNATTVVQWQDHGGNANGAKPTASHSGNQVSIALNEQDHFTGAAFVS